ncbi:MAG TPA: cysteine--tRNA ligase [Micrococcales bacterium]|uniref:Cysteine--tRNA ligase n=1 Tax=Miniimonas arenae TaxID=676201 RepID=A0A5C5BF43_9MICO|nr:MULTISPECIES: cysteine--tRNA ligase [Miniimonas]TNU76727.1 cysteine--tRNA ligase [Miniimonas arenae]HCX85570.1 cysteine--tRNA ligase [Micrococcales bacterium]
MTLHLHDSAARAPRAFVPLEPGRVGMYLCGATVQGEPHVGHLRSALAFDVLVRWLRRSGHDVTLVRNVTDVDDKILAKAAAADVAWWAWAYRFERAFDEAYAAVGVLPPTYSPRATGHVPEMVALMERLVARGHAYPGDRGNVWFDVRSLPDYGSLTHQALDNMLADPDPAPDKRDPHDFALWKAAKPGEPATAAWATPFGPGRPGWHLECSAMAHRYLGEEFDIHAGGIDLRFPHHENEQAQSHAAGYPFARYWLHNAWVTSDGEKMSKSLGNYLAVDQVLERASAPVVRLALVGAHYRSTVEFSDASLAEAAATWERLSGFVVRAAEVAGEADAREVSDGELPDTFVAALDDDVNVAAALASVHEEVRRGNAALAAGDDAGAGVAALRVRGMLDVLGLDPLAEPWRSAAGTDATHDALGVLVAGVLEERAAARANKDWARADALRDRLTAAGVVVEDGAGGARWTIKG